MSAGALKESDIATFQQDGAVCLRGVLTDWIDTIAAGIERNLQEPGDFASENAPAGDAGRFFDDYCNWHRIPEFERVVRESPVANLAASAMRSQSAQFFHDHVLVTNPNTGNATLRAREKFDRKARSRRHSHSMSSGRNAAGGLLPDSLRAGLCRVISGVTRS